MELWRSGRPLHEALDFFVTADEIREMSTVDAVPVVRCKDCKHNRKAKCPMYIEQYSAGYGFAVDVRNDPDDYCSLAERRQTDDK